jgi:hypothetical protein
MLRQAQLKPEYAALYPSLVPGVWYTAAAAAGCVKGATIVRDGPRIEIRRRVLPPQHFEFRGGMDRPGSWVGVRTRRVDRHFPDDTAHDHRRLLALTSAFA